MDPQLFKIFAEAARKLGVPLGDREILLFSKYYECIRLWNQKMNLISVGEDREIPLKHFLDALTPIPFIPHEPLKILDIGSGPGLPGIPMKIAVDNWQVYLLEASRKRTSFLKETIRQLGLCDIFVIHDRVENLIGNDADPPSFDVVISRATFKLPPLIDTARHFLRKDGLLVAMKGAISGTEWAEATQISEKTRLLHDKTHDIDLPSANTPRKIIIYRNIN